MNNVMSTASYGGSYHIISRSCGLFSFSHSRIHSSSFLGSTYSTLISSDLSNAWYCRKLHFVPPPLSAPLRSGHVVPDPTVSPSPRGGMIVTGGGEAFGNVKSEGGTGFGGRISLAYLGLICVADFGSWLFSCLFGVLIIYFFYHSTSSFATYLVHPFTAIR